MHHLLVRTARRAVAPVHAPYCLVRGGAGRSRSFTTELRNQTIMLDDGRVLGYAEYGAPDGRPLFFLHGFPSSRLEAWAMDEVVKRKGIRLICPDRPGFELSSLGPATSPAAFKLNGPAVRPLSKGKGTKAPTGLIPPPSRSPLPSLPTSAQPGAPACATVADYPRDILALADSLNLPKFSVLGGSGGGPFALACAYSHLGIPSHRLAAVGLLASAGPWNVSLPSQPIPGPGTSDQRAISESELKRDVLWSSYLLYLGAWYAPTATSWVLDAAVGVARRLLSKQRVRDRLDGVIEKKQKEEWQSRSPSSAGDGIPGSPTQEDMADNPMVSQSLISAREIRENAGATVLESFRQGAQGAVHEARLLTADWSFSFGSVDGHEAGPGSGPGVGVGVKIWHGARDVNAPLVQIRYMAQRIPRCTLKVYDEDHFGLVKHLDGILDNLLAIPVGD